MDDMDTMDAMDDLGKTLRSVRGCQVEITPARMALLCKALDMLVW